MIQSEGTTRKTARFVSDARNHRGVYDGSFWNVYVNAVASIISADANDVGRKASTLAARDSGLEAMLDERFSSPL